MNNSTIKLTRLYKAAIKWWRSKKPLYMKASDYLNEPTINCNNVFDMELAEAVVEIENGSKFEKKDK
jgi:hypothetical protein